MEGEKYRPIVFVILLLIAIILGITLPSLLFTRHVVIFQLVITILLITPIIYARNLFYKRTYKLMEKVLYLSRHDELTNTFNRRYFEELFLLSTTDALKYNRGFSLIYFDIDNLKLINDKLGHQVGDQALLAFSSAIKDNIRETDLLARYGGDEFVVALFNMDGNFINEKIDSIRNQLEKNPIKINNQEYLVKFSCGISNFPEDGSGIKELIRIADQRMYLAKKQINNVEFS